MYRNKFIITVSLFLLGLSGGLQSQNPYNFLLLPEMIGFSPAVTRLPYYPDGAFDINVFPLTWMSGNTRRLNSRQSLILNLGVRKDEPIYLDNIGISSYAPIYIKDREPQSEMATGAYIAPGLEVTISPKPFAEILNIKILLEAGYSFPIENMTISAGVKGGFLLHSDTSDPMDMKEGIYSYFGVNVTIGFWHLF
jgi:hypothetical protein